MSQKSYDNKPSLYLIPTPIGNMEDITLRAINILKQVDVVFSEDTRETAKLLNYLEINKKLISCHKFNEDKVYVAAYHAIKEGYNVIGLPGATAFVPALIMSGINPNKFLFYGFLDSKKSSKKKELEELKQEKYTLIFYESPYRVRETLELIYEIFGDRSVSVSREISKKYEEVYRGKINEVLEELIEPKGEFVIIVEGNTKKETYDDIDILSHVKKMIDEGYTEKEAIKKVAKLHNLEKNIVYMEYHGGK